MAEKDDGAIAPASDAKRRPDSARDAERNHQHEGERRELQRVDQCLEHERRHRRAECERGAHIAGQKMRDPIPILEGERPVQAQLMVEDRDRSCVRERTQNGASHVAGEQLSAEKHDDG